MEKIIVKFTANPNKLYIILWEVYNMYKYYYTSSTFELFKGLKDKEKN